MTSTCKVGTGGRVVSPSFPGLSSVFVTILALYSIDLLSQGLSSKPLISSL